MSIHSQSSNALAAPPSQMQQFLWTVRREFWEHRSLYIAPFAIAIVALAGYLYALYSSFGELGKLGEKPADVQRALLLLPFTAVMYAIMATAALAALYYSLDALYGERRDRSVLFWKSLPVSDTTTVLAKLAVPLIAMIAVEFLIITITHAAMIMTGSVGIALAGGEAFMLSNHFPFVQMSIVVLYGLVATTLWYAPVYAWFLLVSGWVKRGPVLWAIVPFFAVAIFERAGVGTTHVWDAVVRRLFGGANAAFVTIHVPTKKASNPDSTHALWEIVNNPFGIPAPAPAKFLANPELWIGLALTVVFVIAAIRVRRNRGPI